MGNIALILQTGSDYASSGGEEILGGIFMTFMMAFYCIFYVIWMALMVLWVVGLVLWILMLVDVLKNDFSKENDKLIWLLVLLFTSWLGAIIYYFVIKKPGKY